MDIPKTLIATPEWTATQDAARWLTAREQAHCDAAASPRRRAEKVAGRVALKRLLWETFGVTPLAYEIGSEGVAPILREWPGPSGLVVSLSHSHGLGAASWAWDWEEGTVGVDAQHIRPVHSGLAARALTVGEREQGAEILLLWALKEAAIKARRRLWGRSLQEAVVTVDTPEAEAGTAQIAIAGEPLLTASYARHGNWWLARAARTMEDAVRRSQGTQP